MFEPSDRPRVIGLPPGADFPAELATGILARMKDRPPEALARVTILVNTRRMQRRLKVLLSNGPARLLPRIGLVTDVDMLLLGADLPAPVSALRRRLELAQLVTRLIEADPSVAPRSASVDLAGSLAALMDEMQGEGVLPEEILNLDISDQSGHWERSLRFLSIVQEYAKAAAGDRLGAEGRRRLAAIQLAESWIRCPPQDPFIVAGSTGSRATTSLLMQAVASLPQGAVILPGFEFDMPGDIWATLTDSALSPLEAQDHPQYRFAYFLSKLDMVFSDVTRWDAASAENSRNALISLSLRPAPVTDQWLNDGPGLGDLKRCATGLALLEAPGAKEEALSIAVALRRAVEDGNFALQRFRNSRLRGSPSFDGRDLCHRLLAL